MLYCVQVYFLGFRLMLTLKEIRKKISQVGSFIKDVGLETKNSNDAALQNYLTREQQASIINDMADLIQTMLDPDFSKKVSELITKYIDVIENIKSKISRLGSEEVRPKPINKFIACLQTAGEDLVKFRTKIVKEENDILLEQQYILDGLYQAMIYRFYGLRTSIDWVSRPKSFDLCGNKKTYDFCLLMDEPGLRCASGIDQVQTEEGPIEIIVNFYGTLDFASTMADLDKGGPGQELLKRHEHNLVKQLDALMSQLREQNATQHFRLRISGHSLGGALAKGFTHTLQRAIALQCSSPDEVINQILENQPKTPLKQLNALRRKLRDDQKKFVGLKHLNSIEGITLYALGAPGISHETDEHASLMTHLHDPNFLRVYHHFHERDIIPQFGEAEFLSGKVIPPNVATNKEICFLVPLNDWDIKFSQPLPFPGCNKAAMAAHNKIIHGEKNVVSTTRDLNGSDLTNKLKFSFLMIAVYEIFKIIVTLLAYSEWLRKKWDFLVTCPHKKMEEPKYSRYRQFTAPPLKQTEKLASINSFNPLLAKP
jgi:hypothetical protein